MNRTLFSLPAIMLAFPLMVQAAPGHHHDHGASDPQKIELNAGRKWATDDALRQGMAAIRTLAADALPAAHAVKLTAARYNALANDISAQIGYVVENCKLDPKADAQLHILIGELAEGVETMQGKRADQGRAQGVVKITQTLNTYGKHFNHAGWQMIKLPQ